MAFHLVPALGSQQLISLREVAARVADGAARVAGGGARVGGAGARVAGAARRGAGSLMRVVSNSVAPSGSRAELSSRDLACNP